MTKEQEEAIETMRHWIDFEKEIKKYINKNIRHFKAIVIDIY